MAMSLESKETQSRMPIKNSSRLWGLPARLLHWAMAVVIIGLLCMGFFIANFVDDMMWQFNLTQDHKSWGFVAFTLACIRVVWRIFGGKAPAHPEGAAKWEVVAAEATHIALYILMFAMPLSGWLMASSSTLADMYGIPTTVFGLFSMPDPIVPGDDALEALFHSIHFYCGLALSGLLVLHAGAAIKHHFIDKDDVLKRMTHGKL